MAFDDPSPARGAPRGAGLIARLLVAAVGLLATAALTSYCAAAGSQSARCRLLTAASGTVARRRERRASAARHFLDDARAVGATENNTGR
jgi:hypothetical protein